MGDTDINSEDSKHRKVSGSGKRTVEWIERLLPPIEPSASRFRDIINEVDFYGASHLIARQLGLTHALSTIASWTHGWESRLMPFVRLPLIQYFLGEDYQRYPHLTASHEQTQTLKQAGLTDVTTVGMPFLYAADEIGEEICRYPGSLLVMPAHSLPYTEHGWDADGYVAAVQALRPQFSKIVACISYSCVQKKYWTAAFERAGIPWIVGASTGDRNSLTRMAVIFRSFEYMTTNCIGSHVAYAAYSGCKLSMYGPWATYREEDFKNEKFYVRFPDLLHPQLQASSEERVRREYPQFFVDPWKGVTGQDWGAKALGSQYKRTPVEIARLLRWPGFDIDDKLSLQVELCKRQQATESQLAERERVIAGLRSEIDELKRQLDRFESHALLGPALRARRVVRGLFD